MYIAYLPSQFYMPTPLPHGWYQILLLGDKSKWVSTAILLDSCIHSCVKQPSSSTNCHQSSARPAEHVSGAGAAEFPLTAQTNFCDSRSPLRHLPLPLRSRSPDFWPAPLLLQYILSSKLKSGGIFYRASSYASAVLTVVIPYVCLSV